MFIYFMLQKSQFMPFHLLCMFKGKSPVNRNVSSYCDEHGDARQHQKNADQHVHTNIVVLYKLAMRIMGGRKDIVMKTTTLKKPSFSKEKNEQKIKCCPFQLLCGIHIFSTEIRISAPINENHK
jgi:hypothetical protein